MAQYSVREAVLVRTERGSVWHVTFAPSEGSGDPIKVEVSPVRLEGMTFAAPYSLEEIEALQEDGQA